MSTVSKSVLGKFTGKLGNLVFRKLNGKDVVSIRSEHYKVSKSVAAVEARSNFAVTVKLAKAVNSDALLKRIWTLSKAEGTNSFQKLIKSNIKLVKEGSLTTSNKITPPGYALKITSAFYENQIPNISFICPAGTSLTFPVILFVYLYFEKAGKSVANVAVRIEEQSEDGTYNIEIMPDTLISDMLLKDPNPILFISVSGETGFNKGVYWTSTASLQI